MSTIRRTETQPTALSPLNPTAPKAASATPAAPAAARPEVKDTMAQAVNLSRAAALSTPVGHVPLPSIAVGEPHPAAAPTTGRIALDSPAAREAISKSLDFIAGPKGETLAFAAASGVEPKNLSARAVEKDDLGMTHVRLDRTQDGLKVWGEQLVSHLGKDGKVESLTGDTRPLELAAGAAEAPNVSRKDALASAKAAFGAENKGVQPKVTGAELVYYKANDGKFHKAYRVELTNLNDGPKPLRMNYMLDAHSGQLLTKFNTIDAIELPRSSPATATANAAAPVNVTGSAAPAAPGTAGGTAGTGSSLYSGTVPLSTHHNTDGTWSLQDDTRGGSKTLDAQNKKTASGNVGFKDANNVWGEAKDNAREKAAVDAHYGMEMTWDFYKNVLGRNSIDDKGEALNSYVHLDTKYNNAYWDGKQMQYGDGDGVQFTPLVAIDIAGHEISHGMTERTAGLNYEGESGGLNEAFSDIMGKGVQWYAAQQNPAVKFSWALGAEPYTPGKAGDALRYMDDPTKDGYSVDNYKNYPKQTEVHGSSGIANNAFVLAVQGGTNRTSGQKVDGGIGMEKALKVFYRAEAFYMTPNTTFADARVACAKAAADLYGAGSAEAKTIAAAWSAVGVK